MRPAAPALAAARPWLGTAVGLGVVAGSALQVSQPQLWAAGLYQACVAAGVAVWLLLWVLQRRVRSGGAPGLWGRQVAAWLAAGLVAGGLAGWRASDQAAQALSPALEGADLRITALIAAMPQPTVAGTRLRLQVERATWAAAAGRNAQDVVVPPSMDVTWYAGSWGDAAEAGDAARAGPGQPVFRVGERWDMTVRLKAPHGLHNPHGFDYELWLWEQGVQATGYVRTGRNDPPPQRIASTWRYPVEQARQATRDAIFQRIGGADGADAAAQHRAGVLAALVTGDQRAIDRADWDVFRATGVAHLMAISGLHITLFAWVAAAVVRSLWRRSARLCRWWPAPAAALVLGVALATGYAVFSGWGVPAQRTALMLAVVAALRMRGARWPWPQVWLLACAVAVLCDPWALLQAGFWLSFVAVAVLFATDSGAENPIPAHGNAHLKSLFREQWVVTLALTPLSLLLFGQISLVGLVANLVAIPWITLVVTPLALGGVVLPWLWHGAAWALQPFLAALAWAASWPWAAVHWPAAPWWMGVMAVVGGAVVAMPWPWALRGLGALLWVPVLAYVPPTPAHGRFELLALDIGQGNAVLLRTATHSLLYDAGPRYSRESDAGHRVVVPALRALGVRLDTLLLSHRDSDHTGGAQAVLQQQPQAQLMGSLADEPQWQALRPVQLCERGQQWTWDGVHLQVLHPEPGARAVAGRANAVSCVLQITADNGATALLVGDIEAAQEQALVALDARGEIRLASDVLLVPHHGSKTSSTPAFLQAVGPRTALVQAGYRNRFGHPAPVVLGRYEALGIPVVESVRCGAMTWHSDRPAVVECERQQNARYWHHTLPPR